MRGGRKAYRSCVKGVGMAVLLVAGAAFGQLGRNAGAGVQAKIPVPAVKVQAEDDAGLRGESPLDTLDVPDPTDISVEGSPVGAARAGVWIRANTLLSIRLSQAVSSGVQRNGDTLAAVLLEPVKASNGSVLQPGTPVKATVLSAARAGQMQSAGALSLQVFQVGGLPVISNVLEFDGQEGKREAVVPVGRVLKFQVLGSGDRPEPEERAAGARGGGVKGSRNGAAGADNVSHAPSAINQPAPGSTPLTPIHGMTQPHE
jgi:hypothetical protein